MNQFLEEQYKNLGISREVYEFGEKIEESLKERFAEIDARAEYNQMKVLLVLRERMHWSDHRLPVEPTRLHSL